MDFLNFENHDLYFDEPLTTDDELLLKKAAEAYPSEETEIILLDLHKRLPKSLVIIVALYRFYFYQHRDQDALHIADLALSISAEMMQLKLNWDEMTTSYLGSGAFVSMGLIRFYMLGLKASAYLLMRNGGIEEAHKRLSKIVELDPSDQFGASFLLNITTKKMAVKQAEEYNVTSIFN